MTNLEDEFRTFDRLDAPDLWPDVERRRSGSIQAHHRPSRLIAAVLAFTVAAVGVGIVIRAFGGGTAISPSPAFDPLAAIAVGWTRLPEAPETTQGSALLWTGTELLSWGGYRESDKSYVANGFAFDPSTQTWSSIPSAPAGRSGTHAVWTGTEAIFWGGWDGDRTYSDGFAFDPTTLSWRTITSAPIDPADGSIVVWTGTEMIVWGGGKPGDKSNDTGVAYDPSTDTWHQIADAPVGLNLASGVWTGTDVIVFGSLLDSGNHAATQTAVGASYDPASDTWLEIAPSDLSPQAVAAIWMNDRMIAYDYNWKAEAYSPSTNTWRSLPDLPFQSGECYPDGAVVGTQVFAFGCGEAATWGAGDDAWREVRGGMTEETIEANGQTYKLWRFATLVPAGDVLFLSAEGLTVNKNGVPCYGCAGSPMSLWAYRPAE
jgi:N-acetylneuraminic acid mutarotase